MPEPSKIKDFPDISNKLTAPSKKSVFERQKEEAEAKRQREEAETAAVYRDFVESFDDTSGSATNAGRSGDNFLGGSGYGPSSMRGGGGARRHFAPSRVLKSGPGSLGPAGPPRKRALDGPYPPSARQKDRGVLAFDDLTSTTDTRTAFQASDDEDVNDQSLEERAAPKPTLQLSPLPPGTSVPVIKALLPASLTVDSVRVISHRGDSNERKSLSAIVTLAKDTPASEIDAAVSLLQNQYLGVGYYLSISRHLSSALIGSVTAPQLQTTSSAAHPFGAQPIFSTAAHPLNRAPPPRAGFAPPPQFGGQSQSQYGRGPVSNAPLQVPVRAPSDIKQLKLIHKTVEAILTHGPELEALLMSRSSIQKDEKWAWLWDARSTAGVWYRWKLWEVLSGGQDRTSGRPQMVFEGGAPWRAPEKKLRFEYTTQFEDFVGDEDYDSSEEEGSDDEGAQKPPGQEEEDAAHYLNPLQKAKLTHLLSRLPTTTARLRKGDVARVTAFAISHSGRGSDEVVHMLIDNVEQPFVLSSACSTRKQDADNEHGSGDSDGSGAENNDKEKEDPSSAKLIALYLISDLLSSSSTSGVRHAWRYRQSFEAALRSRRSFKRLGQLEKEMAWGRLRAEKWRRAVTQVLELWEGWCVFSNEAQNQFMSDFIESAEGKSEKEQLELEDKSQPKPNMKKGGWKVLDANDSGGVVPGQGEASSIDVDGEPLEEDFNGEPMLDEEEEADGEPMDEDLDGVPMTDSSDDEQKEAMIESNSPVREQVVDPEATAMVVDQSDNPPISRRKRPRAVDMFADSEED